MQIEQWKAINRASKIIETKVYIPFQKIVNFIYKMTINN